MSQRSSLEQNMMVTPGQLTSLLDCARELLVILSPDGTILHASGGANGVLGLPPDELVGRALSDFVHAHDLRETQEQLRAMADAPNETRKGRCRVRSKGG